MRLLITGAKGFIGANAVRHALAKGYEVHGLTLSGGRGNLRGAGEDAALYECDVRNAAQVREIVERVRPEVIWHLAAYGAYEWEDDPARIAEVNMLGTVNLLAAAHRVGFESMIVAGTSSEYGVKDHPAREDEAIVPNSMYAATKAGATLFAVAYARQFSLPVTALRMYSVYGPFEDSRRFIPTVCAHMNGLPAPEFSDPDNARDFVHIDDVLDAFERCRLYAKSVAGRIYNVGTGIQHTLREVVDLAGLREVKWNAHQSRHWDAKIWVAKTGGLYAATGWVPTVKFANGLRRTAKWWAA